jgi:hypothetical protein
MPKKVAMIDAVFSIDGVGTVVALADEAKWELNPKEPIHRRERIQIRTRSGSCLCTFIRDIEMINRGRERCSIAISLPAAIKLEDVPEGSEVWLERDGVEPVLQP